MTSRILNITRGFRLKRTQALRAVENCACAWVEFGVSVRDLSLSESIVERNKQATLAEPLEYAELRSTFYRPTEAALAMRKGSMKLSRVARYFAASVSAT